MGKTVKEVAEQIVADPNSHPLGNDIMRGYNNWPGGDNDRSFDCRKCGKHYNPAKDQWIFYGLCDECFTHFGIQKMLGRWGMLGCDRLETYTESSDEWLAHTDVYDRAVEEYTEKNKNARDKAIKDFNERGDNNEKRE